MYQFTMRYSFCAVVPVLIPHYTVPFSSLMTCSVFVSVSHILSSAPFRSISRGAVMFCACLCLICAGRSNVECHWITLSVTPFQSRSANLMRSVSYALFSHNGMCNCVLLFATSAFPPICSFSPPLWSLSTNRFSLSIYTLILYISFISGFCL